MPSNHLIRYCPLLPLPSIFPSIKIFSSESTPPIRWPKYWSISFSISPSNEYSGMISFRIDWFDLLADHENLRNLLQHHDLKESLLQCSVFFAAQLSHPYKTTGRKIAQLDLCLNSNASLKLPRFLIAFLPRSKHLLILWL